MALDSDEVVIGSFGHVYVAPVGTALPTDLDTAPAAAWLDLGFLSEDGISFSPGVELNEVNAWQSAYPVRRNVTGRTLEASFTMLQWNKNTLPFALGGGSVETATGVHTYTPPTSGVVDERAMLVEWEDGAKKYRMRILRGIVSDLGGFTLNRGDASGLEVTYAMLAESEVAPFTLLTNDSAFAAA